GAVMAGGGRVAGSVEEFWGGGGWRGCCVHGILRSGIPRLEPNSEQMSRKKPRVKGQRSKVKGQRNGLQGCSRGDAMQSKSTTLWANTFPRLAANTGASHR